MCVCVCVCARARARCLMDIILICVFPVGSDYKIMHEFDRCEYMRVMYVCKDSRTRMCGSGFRVGSVLEHCLLDLRRLRVACSASSRICICVRFRVKQVVCSVCDLKQPVAKACSDCGAGACAPPRPPSPYADSCSRVVIGCYSFQRVLLLRLHPVRPRREQRAISLRRVWDMPCRGAR